MSLMLPGSRWGVGGESAGSQAGERRTSHGNATGISEGMGDKGVTMGERK